MYLINRTNKLVFLLFIVVYFFSCTADTNSSAVQENHTSHSKSTPFVLAIYAQENILDFWAFGTKEYELKSSTELPNSLFLPLGIQKINTISESQITIDLPSDNVVSKIRPKFELKTSFLDSIIPYTVSQLKKSVQKEDYTLIVLPSKPDEYGHLKGCLSCPFSEQEMYLKAKLEWESIFGPFKEIPKENLTDAN